VFRSQLIEDRIKGDIAHRHTMTISQLVQAMDEPATEDIRAVMLWPLLKRALGHPQGSSLQSAVSELQTWAAAGGHRRDLTRSGHDQYTPAIELMDAWWPKLIAAEFGPTLGPAGMSAIEKLQGIGDTSFEVGWWGYVSKDLRRLFAHRERAPYSRVYCGNLPHHHFSTRKLRSRCRAALRRSLQAAMSVTPQQLYGSTCPSDPEPACSDRNKWTYISAIQLPAFPYQNRPTFQQVVTLTRHLPRQAR
jgi:hypothetical protein